MKRTNETLTKEEGPQLEKESGFAVWLNPKEVTIMLSDEFSYYNPDTEETTAFWRGLRFTCDIKDNDQPLAEGEAQPISNYIQQAILHEAGLMQNLINKMAWHKKEELAPTIIDTPTEIEENW